MSHRASIGTFGYPFGKAPNEKDNTRSFSATRQTIIGYKPSNIRSSSAGRESILGMRSEAKSLAPGTFAKPKKKVEPKIYLEKKDVKELAGNIFEFLSVRNYESTISKKGLCSGNKTMFLSMLAFLLKLMDPAFNADFSAASEEDVVRMLKMMGYPYSLPKNFFAAIGAPNNWTSCLHIINWIIEIIRYYEETNVKDNASKELGERTDNEVLNEYVQKLFLQGPDAMEDEGPNELIERLDKRSDHLNTQLRDYDLKIDNLKLAMENTVRDFPDPKELDVKLSQLDDESFHLEQVISKQKNENNGLAAETMERKQTIDYLKYEINIENREKQSVLESLNQQSLTVEESERLVKDIAKTEIAKNKLLQTKAEKANMKHKLTQALDDLVTELETKSQAFNNTIQSEREIFTKCSTFLVSFDHAAIADIKIDDASDQSYVSKLCTLDPRKEIKPTLREILDTTSNSIKQMEDQHTAEKISAQQLEDKIQELNSKIEEQSFKLKRISENYEDKMETLNRENASFSENRQRIQKDIDELREKISELDRQKSAATMSLNNVMNQHEKSNSEFESNQKEVKELLNSDFALALSHKKEIIETLSEVASKFDKIKERLKEFMQ